MATTTSPTVRSPWRLLGGGLVVLGLLLGVVAGWLALTTPDHTTTGRVTGFGFNFAGPCQPTVAFEVDGREYRTKPAYDERWCHLRHEDAATVYYDPSSPQDGRLDRYGEPVVWLLIGAVAALGTAALALIAGRRTPPTNGAPDAPGPLPSSARVLALSCLVTQAVALVDHGTRQGGDIGLVVSVAAGAVLVGWFAAGTLRARPVRSVLVAVFLILGVLVGAGNLADAASSSASEVAEALAVLVLGVTPLVALVRFRTTSWYAWHRRHPRTTGPDVSSLVLVAMLVGALSGLSAPAPEGSPFRLEVRL